MYCGFWPVRLSYSRWTKRKDEVSEDGCHVTSRAQNFNQIVAAISFSDNEKEKSSFPTVCLFCLYVTSATPRYARFTNSLFMSISLEPSSVMRPVSIT